MVMDNFIFLINSNKILIKISSIDWVNIEYNKYFKFLAFIMCYEYAFEISYYRFKKIKISYSSYTNKSDELCVGRHIDIS